MKKFILFVVGVFFLALPVMAQIYNDKYENMVDPMDRAAGQSNAMYSEVPLAGAAEDIKSQDLRYDEAVIPMNEANERHFEETGNNLKTVVELEAKK